MNCGIKYSIIIIRIFIRKDIYDYTENEYAITYTLRHVLRDARRV